jgi:hypothetical protein
VCPTCGEGNADGHDRAHELAFHGGSSHELHGRARRRAVPIICPAPAGRETLNEGERYDDVPSFAVVNAMVS